MFAGKLKIKPLQRVMQLSKAGLTGIELTFTIPQTEAAIQELISFYKERLEIVIVA